MKPKVFRMRFWLVIAWIVVPLSVAGAIAGLVFDESRSNRVEIVFLAVLVGLPIWMQARMRLEIHEDVVRVVNLFWTKVRPRADIVGVSVEQVAMYGRALVLTMRDHRSIQVSAIVSGRADLPVLRAAVYRVAHEVHLLVQTNDGYDGEPTRRREVDAAMEPVARWGHAKLLYLVAALAVIVMPIVYRLLFD